MANPLIRVLKYSQTFISRAENCAASSDEESAGQSPTDQDFTWRDSILISPSCYYGSADFTTPSRGPGAGISKFDSFTRSNIQQRPRDSSHSGFIEKGKAPGLEISTG